MQQHIENALAAASPPPPRPLRVFSGTYNVRGRPVTQPDGELERIDPGDITPWVAQMKREGEALPDLLFFSLQEVMDLNSVVNVVVDSIQPSEDHFARVNIWRSAISSAINSVAPYENEEYEYVGQSTQVGLALLVFGTPAVKASLVNEQTGNVKTGWGGLLGNKGSCMWRAELGAGGPSLCVVASHFASGRDKVNQRNECFETAVSARCFPPVPPPSSGVVLAPAGIPLSHASASAASATHPPQPPGTRRRPWVSGVRGGGSASPPLPPVRRTAGGVLSRAWSGEGSSDDGSSGRGSAGSAGNGVGGGSGKAKANHGGGVMGSMRLLSASVTTRFEDYLFRDDEKAGFGGFGGFGGAAGGGKGGCASTNRTGAVADTTATTTTTVATGNSSAGNSGKLLGYGDSGELLAYGDSGGGGGKRQWRGVLEHDLVLWAGDLNYALHDVVEAEEARESLQNKVEPCAHQLAAADQLAFERAAGRAFRGFKEGPLHFRASYRVLVGADAYDPKRCPAWTDRVLWCERAAGRRPTAAAGGDTASAGGSGGGGAGGDAVGCVAYSCAWSAKLSDHKPVFALLDVNVAQLTTNAQFA